MGKDNRGQCQDDRYLIKTSQAVIIKMFQEERANSFKTNGKTDSLSQEI